MDINKQDDQFYSAGIDSKIKIWNIQEGKVEKEFIGHMDSITSLSISNENSYLLSNSMDNTLKIWDIRSSSKRSRALKTFRGATHDFEKNLIRSSWSFTNRQVASGSSNGLIYIWDVNSKKIKGTLGGHEGTINSTQFHPHRNLLASCSSDARIILTELPDLNN